MFQPSGSSEFQQQARADALALSPLEWRVLLLAVRDADRGCVEHRFPKLGRLFEMFTGTRPIQRLADERLEKLRRFVCLKRRGDRRADQMAGDLLAMGFVPVALRTIEAVTSK
jgi:hypothetical protein